MARKVLKIGGLYLAYEVGSTLLLMVLAWYGLQLPGF